MVIWSHLKSSGFSIGSICFGICRANRTVNGVNMASPKIWQAKILRSRLAQANAAASGIWSWLSSDRSDGAWMIWMLKLHPRPRSLDKQKSLKIIRRRQVRTQPSMKRTWRHWTESNAKLHQPFQFLSSFLVLSSVPILASLTGHRSECSKAKCPCWVPTWSRSPGLSSHRPDTMVPNLRSALRAEKNSQLIAEQCALRRKLEVRWQKSSSYLFVIILYYIHYRVVSRGCRTIQCDDRTSFRKWASCHTGTSKWLWICAFHQFRLSMPFEESRNRGRSLRVFEGISW